jgi:hypothetical protein
MEISDAVNWFLVSLLFLAMSIFPELITILAESIGVIDETNVVYLIVIGILILIVFYLNIRISRLSMQVRKLIQEIGIRENKKNK